MQWRKRNMRLHDGAQGEIFKPSMTKVSINKKTIKELLINPY